MSWSRFGSCDVYTFPSERGGECCSCPFGEPKDNGWNASFVSLDLAEFLAHIKRHEDAGHNVPPGIGDLIAEEWAEFFPAAESVRGTTETKGASE